MTLQKRSAAALTIAAILVSTAPVALGSRPAAVQRPSRTSAVGGFWTRLLTESGNRPDIAATWIAAAEDAAASVRPFAQVATGGHPSRGHIDSYRVSRDFGFSGDLDGDHRSDIVDIAQTFLHSNVAGDDHDHYDIAAYSGRSGQQLWATRITPPAPTCVYNGCKYLYRVGDAFATSLTSGPGIETAVFTVVNDGPAVTFDPTNPLTWSQWGYLFAVDLATVDHRGRQVWSRHIEGRLDMQNQIVTLNSVPLFQGLGHLESSTSNDWLLTVSTGRMVDNSLARLDAANALSPLGLAPYIPDGDLFSSQAEVVDGRTGVLSDIGGAVVGPNAVRDLTIVGDLSGDRREDIIESHPYATDDIYTNNNAMGYGVVSAIQSSDGTQLWAQVLPSAAIPTEVTSVGDVTGDHKADVVVSLAASGGTTPQVVLLDGATGAVKWEKAADSVLPLGDIRKNGHNNVLLAAVDTTTKRSVHLTAYDGSGNTLWAASATLPGAAAAHVVAATLYDAGDLDGDGLSDVDVSVVTQTGTSSSQSFATTVAVVGIGYVSARYGHALPRLPNEQAIFGPLDGHGDDADTTYTSGIILRSGQTAKPLWQIDFGRRITWATAATDGTRLRCGDLLAAAYFDDGRGGTTAVVGVFDRLGRLLWTRVLGRPVTAHPRTVVRDYHC